MDSIVLERHPNAPLIKNVESQNLGVISGVTVSYENRLVMLIRIEDMNIMSLTPPPDVHAISIVLWD